MREKITAKEGHIFTNGEIYGTEIYLADGVSADAFREITLEEYQALFTESTDEVTGCDDVYNS
jgi:hypothetical protein